MKNKFFYIFILLIVNLFAKDVIDKGGSCEINWTNGEILCYGDSESGQSKFKAKRAATIIAQRNLLEVIKGIQIDSTKNVKDSMIQSDIIRSSVSGIVKGAEVLKVIYNKKEKYATAKIKMMMGKDLLNALISDDTQTSWNSKIKYIFSNFSQNLYAQEIFSLKDKATLIKLQNEFKDKNSKEIYSFIEQVISDLSTQNYTGLLIDVQDIPTFKKAMLAKLVDKNGKEIYPGNIVSKDLLIKNSGSG
jgi:hypothetical protein